jgi:uncharacterized protein (DUF58 family)
MPFRRSPKLLPNQPKRKPSLDFSVTGLIYTSMMLFMGLAAINSQANLLFGVFGLMIGVLVIAGVISRIVLRKLDVRRVFPDYVVVGEPANVQYEFHNRKRFWPSLSVTVSELGASDAFTRQAQAYLLHAAAGTTAHVPMLVVPKRRGLHVLEKFQLSTSFPFGFVKRAIDRSHRETALVYPPLAEVDGKLLSMCLSAEQSGARMRPRRGGQDEFYGVKEYRQGESPRMIYWRRSARTGTLVSKEMTHIAPPRIIIFVDTFIKERTLANHAEVERAIAMAASLASRTIDQGLAVGLCVWNEEWMTVQANRGKRHAHELLAQLARLPLNTSADHKSMLDHGQKLLRSGTTPILLTPHEYEQSLAELTRSNWIIISATSEQSRRWFKFNSELNFVDCIPFEQLPRQ